VSPRVLYANVKSEAPRGFIFASGPLVLTLAKVPSKMACECQNRTTSYGERFVKRRGLFCLAVALVAKVWSLRKPAGQ
jgi:hypothetical protein